MQRQISGLDITKSDVRQASLSTFRRILDNVWKDGVVSQNESETIAWVARSLELSEKDARATQQEYAVSQFRITLTNAMDDGILSDSEFKHLDHIARTIGLTASDMAKQFFNSEGERFLLAMFLSATERGNLESDQWNTLVQTSKRFGFSDTDLKRLVQIPAKQFVEHILADAKADSLLNADEREKIEWLLSTLPLDENFRQYVHREMNEFEFLAKISKGHLPSLNVPVSFEIRAGEIAHAYLEADLVITKMLKSGPSQVVHHGLIALLDNRAIFQSATKAQSINYRKIIALSGDNRIVKFQLNNKPVWSLQLSEDNPWFLLIFRKAVALANQTATRASEGAPSRHIPREVRQRVWQRYSGQCADCGAKNYLEFDHIVPFAKGGSNSDANVQLLCRRCNLQKSDHL